MAGTAASSSSPGASKQTKGPSFASLSTQFAAASVGVLVVAAVTALWHDRFAPSGTTTPTSWNRALSCRRSCPEAIDVSTVLTSEDEAGTGVNLNDPAPRFFSFPAALQPPLLDACELFSDSYRAARDRFRSAARRVPGARLVALPVVPSSGSGSTREDSYTMDLAVLPGSIGSNLVVHTSGVHGVEGYAGSAIQIAYLKTMEAALQSQRRDLANEALDEDRLRPTIILVHAFNPFGMAHFRRVNENNVDLNRNGLRHFSLVADNSQNPNQGSGREERYDRFRFLFSPEIIATISSSDSTKMVLVGAWLGLRQWLAFAAAFVKHGIPRLKEAMVGGQYHHSTGIFYGGDRVQSSFTVLEEWLVNEYLSALTPLHADTTKGSTMKVTWIDVHTGLGPSGEDTILPCRPFPLSGPSQRRPESIMEEWFPRSHHPGRSSAGTQVRSGYDYITGQVGDYFASNLRPYAEADDLTFVVQELGTISPPRVGHALIVENALYHLHPRSDAAGDARSEQDRSRTLMSRAWLGPAFYPDRAPWRVAVVTRGLDVLLQAIRRTSSTIS